MNNVHLSTSATSTNSTLPLKTVDFTKFSLPIHENIHKQTPEKQLQIYEYLSSLNEKERKAYLIANEHLKSSFNIIKSNGLKEHTTKK